MRLGAAGLVGAVVVEVPDGRLDRAVGIARVRGEGDLVASLGRRRREAERCGRRLVRDLDGLRRRIGRTVVVGDLQLDGVRPGRGEGFVHLRTARLEAAVVVEVRGGRLNRAVAVAG